MDSEEDYKIRKAYQEGKPQTDEGAYYHEPWWEAYKGSVKGKLGGLIVGAFVGALVGTAAVFALPLLGVALAEGATIGGMIAASSAAGMMYGLHEFGDIGKVVGSNAATAEKQEKRMRSFENGKFAELKQELDEIKELVGGKREASKPAAATSSQKAAAPAHDEEDHENYRTTHCDDTHCPPGKAGKFIFWKVAAIGLAVGIGFGALLAYGGVAAELVAILGHGALAAEGGSLTAASMTIGGLIGASFGINRDMFRQVFDKTDLWFKGILQNGHKRDKQIAKAHEIEEEVKETHKPSADVATSVLHEGYINYPTSNTYHRDRVLAAAEKALLSFDHTRATPQ